MLLLPPSIRHYSRYLRNSGAIFLWFAIRALGQVATIVLLSRALGAEGFGLIVAVTAVAALLIPFAGMGLPNLLLRDGARDPQSLAPALANAFRVWVISATACSAVATVLAWALLPRHGATMALLPLIASEIATAGLVDLFGRYEQARSRFLSFAAISSSPILGRLLTVGAYVVFAEAPDAIGAAWTMTLSNVLVSTLLLTRLAPWRAKGVPGLASLSEAAPFAIAGFALRAQAEFNKPVLAWNGFTTAGQFAAAQRMVDFAALPLTALQEALWPRIFSSPQFERDFRRALLALTLAASLVAGLLALAAPLLPLLLGPDFVESMAPVRWLALLPLFQVVRNMMAARLTHIGRTDVIGVAYMSGAVTSILGVLLLVPLFGWSAAVLMAYVSEAALIAIQLLYPRVRKHAAALPR